MWISSTFLTMLISIFVYFMISKKNFYQSKKKSKIKSVGFDLVSYSNRVALSSSIVNLL